MCGILGYIGKENTNQILLKGLKKLDYRGYDSAGFAFLSNPNLKLIKDKGKIEEIEKKNDFNLKTEAGISHTRWSTHGKVTQENAHPHTSCDKKIAIVHNGIIENYRKLKKDLIKRGHNFSSETDSEVVAHLIEEYKKEGYGLFEACKKTAEELEGSYAILVLDKTEDYIVALRNKSPLVVGEGEGGNYVASDVTAFLDQTKRAIYLRDGDVAKVGEAEIEIHSIGKGEVKRKTKKIEWDPEEVSKEGHKYYMIKEIEEAPKAIKKAINQGKDNMEKFREVVEEAETVWLTGCGTSYHAALVGEYLLNKEGIKARAILSHELPNYIPSLSEKDLIIAVSQSGETADLLNALRKIGGKKSPKTFSIVNVRNSSLTRLSDRNYYIKAGPEIGVAATKSYIGQLSLLYLLHFNLKGEFQEGREKLKNTAQEIGGMIPRWKEKAKRFAEELKDKDDLYFIGRGLSHPTALEGALKFKEISYAHGEGFPGGELKHGTLSLIEEGVPCVVIAPKGKNYEEIISNAKEVEAREGTLLGVSQTREEIFDYFFQVPNSKLSSILSTVPLHLFAYYSALKRENNPDKPQNLAKAVTVQ